MSSNVSELPWAVRDRFLTWDGNVRYDELQCFEKLERSA